MEMEKSKFTAKFRMRGGTGAASSRGGGSTKFRSAGASSAGWGNSRVSPSSMSSMSSTSSMRSTASRSSFKSSVSSTSSMESSVESEVEGQEKPKERRMSTREQRKELERSQREKRVSLLAAEVSGLKATKSSITRADRSTIVDTIKETAMEKTTTGADGKGRQGLEQLTNNKVDTN